MAETKGVRQDVSCQGSEVQSRKTRKRLPINVGESSRKWRSYGHLAFLFRVFQSCLFAKIACIVL